MSRAPDNTISKDVSKENEADVNPSIEENGSTESEGEEAPDLYRNSALGMYVPVPCTISIYLLTMAT